MVINLEHEKHDPFIDYLKGISILFVILTHNLPFQKEILFPLWGAQAVPLFLIIQAFHITKKGVDNVKVHYDLKKLFTRIIKPFLLVNLIEIAYLSISQNPLEVLSRALSSGGIGFGSYYVWIYLQFFFLIPVFCLVFNKVKNRLILLSLFVSICIMLELLSSFLQLSPQLYRLLSFRYIFLIFIGYLWGTENIKLNNTNTFLSFIGLFFTLLLGYTELDLEPFIYQKAGWDIFHWICYFYVGYIFVFLLYKVYKILGRSIKHFLKEMGKYSYEIYLCQMLVFTMFPAINFIGNIYVEAFLRITLTTSLSIFPVLWYKKLKS